MDDIRKRLAQIDRELAGYTWAHRLVDRHPLVAAAAGLCIGILLRHLLPVSDVLCLTVTGLCIAVAGWLLLRRDRRPIFMACTALIAFVCLGSIRISTYQTLAPANIANLVSDKPVLATIRGRVLTDPRVSRDLGWDFARFKPVDPGCSFYLRLAEVESTKGWVEISGTVRFQADEAFLDIEAGDNIQAYCRLSRFSPPTNPGQFDTAAYLANRNIYISASIESRKAVSVIESSQTPLPARARHLFHRAAARALLDNHLPEAPDSGLLQALLLGRRSNIDESTYEAFRKTGLLHFVSLSGMHVGILMAAVYFMAKTAGLLKRARAIVCIAAVTIFLLVVPPRAPTLRAAVIALTFCAALLVRRRTDPLNTLSLAAIILLLVRPTQLFEAGFQLSFATVLGILMLAGTFQTAFKTRLDYLLGPDRTDRPSPRIVRRGLAHRLAIWASSLLAVGMAAWLGGAPVMLYHFGAITPMAAVWTVLAFPLVSSILVLGLMKIILYFLLPSLSFFLGQLVSALAAALIALVKLLAAIDIFRFSIGRVPLYVVLLSYALLITAAFLRISRPFAKGSLIVILSAALTGWLVFTKYQRTHPNTLVLTCLDVSHGQAVIAHLPSGKNIVFDAGSLHRSNPGRRVINPYLRQAGLGGIEAIIISHNDVDHLNAVPEIAESFEVSSVYANGKFFSEADQWGTAKYLKECLAEQKITIEPVPEKMKFGETTVEIIWPPVRDADLPPLSDNDSSLVSLLTYGRTRLLICSDIEEFAQQRILRLYPGLRADVVMAPHHSLRRNEEFLRALKPQLIICSTGRREFERHDLSRWSEDIRLFFTARDGAITMSADNNGHIKAKGFARKD